MTEWKIKGTGPIREVYRDGVLLGTIHRRETVGMVWRITPTRATGSKQTRVSWYARWPDGSRVRHHHDDRPLVFDHMKDWKRDWPWLARLEVAP